MKDGRGEPANTVLRHDRETGESTALVRFEAGTRFPAHNHPGDHLYTPPNGTHAASSERGCVFLVTLPKPVEILKD
ncbi:MAG: cupin domain-containing protein [Candidatus Rokuibacteriota bacterium]